MVVAPQLDGHDRRREVREGVCEPVVGRFEDGARVITEPRELVGGVAEVVLVSDIGGVGGGEAEYVGERTAMRAAGEEVDDDLRLAVAVEVDDMDRRVVAEA